MSISLYVFFAIIATVVNISTQYISFESLKSVYFLINYELFVLYFSMGLATFSGLVLKYFLDKKYIFNHINKSKKDAVKNFSLYSFMGVFTTMIFWGSETFFYYFVNIQYSHYIGGVLGLFIGYVVKYFLDKKYVFGKR